MYIRIKCGVLPLGGFYLHSGTELIPLFPYLRAGLQKKGGGSNGGIAPGNRLLATDHGLAGFPDLKVNPGLDL